LAVVVLGTFLPWLRSGRRERDSYAGRAAIRDLVDVHGALRLVMWIWPFLGVGCALAIALLLLGLPRSGAAVALVASVYAGGVAIWVLSAHGRGAVRAATSGPVVTLLGALAAVIGAGVCLARRNAGEGSRDVSV
jgi:hypothetical protein